jgi:hypothetical protein
VASRVEAVHCSYAINWIKLVSITDGGGADFEAAKRSTAYFTSPLLCSPYKGSREEVGRDLDN